MKLIVAGSRDLEFSLDKMHLIIKSYSFYDIIDEIVHGGCRGIDTSAKEWAIKNKVKHKVFEADWDKEGKSAGPLRNQRMAEYGDALIAILKRDAENKGTKSMINCMLNVNKPVVILTRK